MTQRTGIIVAMEVEIARIKENMSGCRKKQISGMDFYEGRIDGVTVVAARCGIGKVCAAMCAQTMILQYRPNRILGAGIAGSLKGLPIGGVAIAKNLVQHDFDLLAFGYPAGYIPAVKSPYLVCSEEMVNILEKTADSLGYVHSTGTIVSGDCFVSSNAQKQTILENIPEAIACEMEGAAIAQVCVMNNMPFCVIRCISDNGDENSKDDYPAHEALASAGSAEMILKYLREGADHEK